MEYTDLEIKKLINNYIDNDSDGSAILIDGEWGSGKTYFIKKEFVEKRNNIIYISIYGVKNINDIDSKICYEILSKPEKFGNILKYKKLVQGTAKILDISCQLFQSKVSIKDLTDVINMFNNIKDYIIVFDDLERCELSINEVLGYINNLVEHKGLKTIIIANEKEIEKINYNNYELKILTCLNRNINFEDSDETFNMSNKDSNNKLSLDILRTRVNNLYKYNSKYNNIKEKLVGQTIIYKPNLDKVYSVFINKYNNDKKEIYEILSKKKKRL